MLVNAELKIQKVPLDFMKNQLKKCHENYTIIVTKRRVVLWQVEYTQK